MSGRRREKYPDGVRPMIRAPRLQLLNGPGSLRRFNSVPASIVSSVNNGEPYSLAIQQAHLRFPPIQRAALSVAAGEVEALRQEEIRAVLAVAAAAEILADAPGNAALVAAKQEANAGLAKVKDNLQKALNDMSARLREARHIERERRHILTGAHGGGRHTSKRRRVSHRRKRHTSKKRRGSCRS